MRTGLRKVMARALSLFTTNSSPKDLTWQSIPAITEADLQEVRQFFRRKKFFIFGHARSGTTLLARLIRVHPSVHCNWQAHFFTRQPFIHALVSDPNIHEWLTRRSNRWNQGRDPSALLLRINCDFFLEREAAQLGKEIVGDKSPNNLVHGEAVLRMASIYPDASLIFIVRDGRDAVLSHRFQTFIDNPQHLNQEDRAILEQFIAHPEPFLRGERSIFTSQGLQAAAQSWVENVTETHRLGKEIYGARYYALRFEDLIRQPWEVMQSLWLFLGADLSLPGLAEALENERTRNPDADWQNQKASAISQSLQKGKSGSWRQLFTSEDRQAFLRIAGATLEEWGYPID